MMERMSPNLYHYLLYVVKDLRAPRAYINTNILLHAFTHHNETKRKNFDSLKKSESVTLAKMVPFRTSITISDLRTLLDENEDNFSRLMTIFIEISTIKLRNERVPNTIPLHHWIQLLGLDIAGRRKYLAYLAYLERKQHLFVQLRKASVSQRIEKRKDKKQNFSPTKAKLFSIKEESIERLKNCKLFRASMFGTHLLVDCSYETIIPSRDIYYCAEFIEQLWRKNRNFRDPFHIVFCNLDKEGSLMMELKRRIRDLEKPDFPFHSTSLNYLELYPKEKLVYLTPHCEEVLYKYSLDDIYIIGGLVDQQNNICEPMSLIRAEKESIRKAKLPIDLYLRWGNTKKTLTMSMVVSILNEMKDTNNWKYAFELIPKKKLIEL